MEIRDKPKIKISKKMDAVIKKMKEACKGNEFLLFILASKDNPFRWVDAVAPPQEVTSTAIDVKKNGKMSEYEKIFLAYMKNEDLRCVGTFHFHPIEGFSGIDDSDLDNHACFNTTHGLPFVDISMDTEEEYFARAVIKIGAQGSKQIFQIECECEIDEDIEINDFDEKIDKIAKDAKLLFSDGYKINEKKLKEAITPEVDVSEFLKNIKERTYNTVVLKEERVSMRDDLGISKIKWEMQFDKKRKRLLVDVINDVDNQLQEELEKLLQTNSPSGKIIEMDIVNDGFWKATLYCGSRKDSKIMKREIYETFLAAKEEIEDYLEAFMYAGGGAEAVNEAIGRGPERDSCQMYGIRRFY